MLIVFPGNHPDEPALINEPATEFLRKEMIEGGERKCDLCGESVSLAKEEWRGHIGGHILRALCKAPEPRPLISTVSDL